MQRKILKYISVFILIVFTSCSILQPSHSYAATNTGTIKIFSEVKGIEIFLDEKSQGQDMVVLNNVEMGSHYIKAVKDGATIFSELVNVAANATTTVLIKDTGQVKQKILGAKYKEQQEYKAKKLDILLSKSYQTTGTSNTYSTYFPGYYYYYGGSGYGTTTSKSTQSEITDWRIVQGGVQQISDNQFAQLVNDKGTLTRIDRDAEAAANIVNWGVILGLSGLVLLIAGIAAAVNLAPGADDTGPLILCTFGTIGTLAGYGMVDKMPYSGHWVSPSIAAKQAYDYNQDLKKQLGLPESYEP